jgi:hypothetical protein
MRRIALPLVLAALLAGCSRPPAELAPVQGQVFYRGRPLPGGTIVFTPDPERGGHGPQAVAEITSDGRYVLSTGGKKGAVPGWHLITIASPGDAPSVRLPGHYRDPDRSGQRAEVKADRANQCDLHLD